MPKLKAASLRPPFNFNGVGWRKIVAEKMGDVGLRRLSYLCPFFFCLIAAACSDSSSDDPQQLYYSVGGTISDAQAPVKVIFNGVSFVGAPTETTEILSVADGAFKFTGSARNAEVFESGANYQISIVAPPSGQVCTVANSAGVIGTEDVTNITITCDISPLSTITAFKGGEDGGYPDSGLDYGSDGRTFGVTTYGGRYGMGTIYRYDPASDSSDVIHNFAGGEADGANPASGLTLACDGLFYATTTKGGAHDAGTFLKFTQDGSVTVLHSFGGGFDGELPQGHTIDTHDCPNPSPQFYGTTTNGGMHGQGTVYTISASGEESVLHSFGEDPAGGLNPTAGLSRSPDNHFYGTTYLGGEYGRGTFFRITTDGDYTVIHSFGNEADGAFPNTKVRSRDDGSFYGTTEAGGKYGKGSVFKIGADRSESVFYSFGADGQSDGQVPASRLRFLDDGSIYGVTYLGGDYANGSLYKISPEGVGGVLYSFTGAGNDGRLPNSSLLVGEDGFAYGTTTGGGEYGYGTIFRIDFTE